MERDTDGIGSGRSDEFNILTSYVIVLEKLPELVCKVRSNEFPEHLVDHADGIGLAESEHIAFRIEPIAEIRALDEESGSVRSQKVSPVDTDKVFRSHVCGAGASTQSHGGQDADDDVSDFHDVIV